MLATTRVLMSKPNLLLLNELSIGLASLVVNQILGTVSDLQARGIPILFIEHNMSASLRTAHRACVIETEKSSVRELPLHCLGMTNFVYTTLACNNARENCGNIW
jgi:ABC-type branched-subunit amino acid transport system ATPase component